VFVPPVLPGCGETIAEESSPGDSPTWISIANRWSIDTIDGLPAFLFEPDYAEIPYSLFCAQRIADVTAITFEVRVLHRCDSLQFGISLQAEEDHVDVLISGGSHAGELVAVHKSLNIRDIYSINSRKIPRPVALDTAWHRVRFAIDGQKVNATYDSVGLGSIDIPRAFVGQQSWGFAARGVEIAIRDPAVHSRKNVLKPPIAPGSLTQITFGLKGQGGSSRVLGF
jgi:hypothetical protein